jgi:hypothetical protein
VITSTAERQAAVEFAKAAAMRPRIVGAGLEEIARDPEISRAVFDILETQQTLEGETDITLVPKGSELLQQLAAIEPDKPASAPASKAPESTRLSN